MARYIIPTVAVSGLYSIFRYWSPPNDAAVPAVLSIDEAITNLNSNRNVVESLRVLSEVKNHSRLFELSTGARGLLAVHGSKLCDGVETEACPFDLDDLNFGGALESLSLGERWKYEVDWLNRIACDEDDLACPDFLIMRRPLQMERLLGLLHLLSSILEKEDAVLDLNPKLIHVLYAIYHQCHKENRLISVLCLKLLSTLAIKSEKLASTILNSDWLPLLAHLMHDSKSFEFRLLAYRICSNALYKLGFVSYKLMANVFDVHVPETEPQFDIVLIHGLRGNVAYTWRQKDRDSSSLDTECWPKDWLPLDIKDPFRIIGVDYPSFIFHFSGLAESLQERSSRCRHQLKEAHVGKRPVVFISHSMGGLLVKRMLLDDPQLRKNTVGILFIATPHRGSPIASWGYSAFAPSIDVQFLHEENELNRQLNDDFEKVCDEIPVIASMLETKESPLIGYATGIIVPTHSAVFQKGAVYHIEEIHHDVCKPSERTSPSYGVVLNFLRDCISETAKRPRPPTPAAS